MKSTLLVSTATAAILTAFVVSSAQEMPQGGKGDGAVQNKGTQSTQQQPERPDGPREREQNQPQVQPEQGKRKQQAQPKPDRDQRQQTTGQRDQDQRRQEKGKQEKGKQAQPKPDRNRGQAQDEDRKQRPQTTGQGQRDQGKAKQAQPKTGAGQDRDAASPDRAGRTDERTTAQDREDRQDRQGRLQLNVEQRSRIRETVFARSDVPRVSNVNFRIAVGTAVPARVRVVTVPPVIVEYYPRFRNHLYFVAHDEIIIVDNRRRIVAVIPVETAGVGGTGSGGAAVAVDLSPDEIREVQLVLIERGYELEADGVFGPRTRQALISFQQKQGLQATGRIDSRTVAELGVSVRSNEQPSTTGQGGGSGQVGNEPASPANPGAAQRGSGEPAQDGTVGQGGSTSSPASPGASERNAPPQQPQANPGNPAPGPAPGGGSAPGGASGSR